MIFFSHEPGEGMLMVMMEVVVETLRLVPVE